MIVKSEVAKISTLQSWTATSTTDFHSLAYRESIIITEFLETNMVPSNTIESWDVSETKDGSVMAWVMEDTENPGMNNLYIGGDESVYANPDSSDLFYGFKNLKEIKLDVINTSKITIMNWMFNLCEKLTSLELTYFDTSKVTNMVGMSARCSNFMSLDLSNFNNVAATNMFAMFKNCISLTELTLNIQNSKTTVDGLGIGNIFDNTPKLHKLTMTTAVTVPLNLDYTGCVPAGTTFLGWFDNLDGSGKALTSLSKKNAGTFYAVFK